jgi:hypothetical protein
MSGSLRQPTPLAVARGCRNREGMIPIKSRRRILKTAAGDADTEPPVKPPRAAAAATSGADGLRPVLVTRVAPLAAPCVPAARVVSSRSSSVAELELVCEEAPRTPRSDVAELSTALNELTTSINTMTTAVAAVRRDCDRHREAFAAVDESLGTLNDNVNKIHRALSTHLEEHVAVLNRLGAIEQAVKAIQTSADRGSDGAKVTSARAAAAAASARVTLLCNDTLRDADFNDSMAAMHRANWLRKGELMDPNNWTSDVAAQRTILRRIQEEIVADTKPNAVQQKVQKQFDVVRIAFNAAVETSNGTGQWITSIDCLENVHSALMEIELLQMSSMTPPLISDENVKYVREEYHMLYDRLRSADQRVASHTHVLVATANARATQPAEVNPLVPAKMAVGGAAGTPLAKQRPRILARRRFTVRARGGFGKAPAAPGSDAGAPSGKAFGSTGFGKVAVAPAGDAPAPPTSH